MNQFPLNSLTRGSRDCAFFLHSTEPGSDVEITQLIPIYAALLAVR